MSNKLYWDAGDLGCGELIMDLHKKMRTMNIGDVIEVIAQDIGAKEDLPAWSKLTGHIILESNHPTYVFKKT